LSKNYFMKLKNLLCVLFSIPCFSQNEPIEADRPDQTETPAIVPKGMFQVESGFSFQKNNSESNTFSLPSTLWKYGISKKIELRLITELVLEKNFSEKQNGFLPIAIGLKINLFDEIGMLPKTSLISHVEIKNIASSIYKNAYYIPNFRFTMQHTLNKNFNLGYNLGAEWDGFTKQSTLIYTLTSGYSITHKLGSYLELFGFAPQNEIAFHNLDGGFTYLINNNFMIDFSSGFGITSNAPKHYFSFGFSFRI
jgi:Putative MetA-pathway of phenol degradation